jgi:hypothetical protein
MNVQLKKLQVIIVKSRFFSLVPTPSPSQEGDINFPSWEAVAVYLVF